MEILQGANNLVGGLSRIAVNVTGLLFTLSFIFFVITIIAFLNKRRGGDAKGLEDAKNMLGWSIIAMFVLVSIWGIVFFISNNLSIGIGGCSPRPSAPGVTQSDPCQVGGSSRTSGSGTRTGSVGSDVFDSSGNAQGCYQYTNSECLRHNECQIDSVENSCVPRTSGFSGIRNIPPPPIGNTPPIGNPPPDRTSTDNPPPDRTSGCSTAAAPGDKVCRGDSDCQSGERCVAKFRCLDSVTICKR
jgi:hypothetical protein